MNKRQLAKITKNTISLEEFTKDFTPEMNQRVEAQIKYYDMLKALKQTRKQQGLTQAELAEKAKLPRTTITKIESGSYNPTLQTLATIAAALNKTLCINLI